MPGPARVTYSHHAPGLPHARDTVRKMAELAERASHTYAIRHLATEITRNVPSKQPLAELRALYQWVRDNIRYRNDPLGCEWLQSPERTLAEGAGDCDDIGCLLDALCRTLGRETRYLTVGDHPDAQRHVYMQAHVPGVDWVTLDPVLEPPAASTRPRSDVGRFGFEAVGFRRCYDNRGREVSLGAPTDARFRLLWQTVPYFPEIPPTSGYADPRDAGRPAPSDPRYRSPQVAGAAIGRGTAAPSGVMLGDAWALARGIPQIKALIKQGKVKEAQALALKLKAKPGGGALKTIGKAVGGAVKAVGKLAPLAPIIAAIPVVGTAVAAGITAAAVVSKVGKVVGGAAKATHQAVKPVVTAAQAARTAPRPAAAPRAPATTAPRVVMPTQRFATAAPSAVLRAPVKPKTAAPAPAAKLAKVGKVTSAPKGKPSVKVSIELGSVDPHRHRIVTPSGQVLYTQKDALAGWFTKSQSAVLGAAQASPASLATQRTQGAQLARAAVAAVERFIKSRADHRPPGKPLPEVQAFQQFDLQWPTREGGRAALTLDGAELAGVWGSNTRMAAAWYTGAATAQLPPILPATNIPVTWGAPTAAAIVPTPAPAPRPAPTPRAPTPAPIPVGPGGVQPRPTVISAPAPSTVRVPPGTPVAVQPAAPRVLERLPRMEPQQRGKVTITVPDQSSVKVTPQGPVSVAPPVQVSFPPTQRYAPFEIFPREKSATLPASVAASGYTQLPTTTGPVPKVPMSPAPPPAFPAPSPSGGADSMSWLPLPSGPTYPGTVVEVKPAADRDWMLWAFLGYLYLQRKRAA